LIGYEIEIRSIPKNYLKIINNLIWGFIWNNKVNQVDRNMCCMDIEEGGLEMINLFSFVKSKQIKVLYKIMHSGKDFHDTCTIKNVIFLVCKSYNNITPID
jgi:hypothetical protein